MLNQLHFKLNDQGPIGLKTWMINSAAVHTTCASSGASKRVGLSDDHALARSRGGLTIKVHMLGDANGVRSRFLLSDGQASDIS